MTIIQTNNYIDIEDAISKRNVVEIKNRVLYHGIAFVAVFLIIMFSLVAHYGEKMMTETICKYGATKTIMFVCGILLLGVEQMYISIDLKLFNLNNKN